MKRKFGIFAALLAASLTLTQSAQAGDSLLGALLGAGAGVVVGQAVGGRDGAIIGGGIGAITGAAIASERHRARHVYAPARYGSYYDEPVVVERRHVRRSEHRWDDRPSRGWRERHWDDRSSRNWRDYDRDDHSFRGWRHQ